MTTQTPGTGVIDSSRYRVTIEPATTERPVPDLMGVFKAALEDARPRQAASGFRAAFSWAMRQDFPPDHAERIRREAWGRDDG